MLGSGNLITLLVELIVAAIVIYAVYLFLNMLTLPAPIRTIILLLIAVVAIVFLAGLFNIHI